MKVKNRDRVSVTFLGDGGRIGEIVDFMRSGKELNNWGAAVTEVIELETGKRIEDHTVTTENVDSFDWSPNVTFYL